jgi:predicted DNA-binding transcriptional regulator YafY
MAYENARELVRIAFMAASYQGVSLAMIEEEFGCSRRTAQRKIEALVATFPETDRQLDYERRPWWRLPSKGLAQLLAPTAEELAALSIAADELERSDAASEVRALRSLHHKIRALIPTEQGRRLDADEEILLVAMGHAARPGPRAASNVAVDNAISTALKGSSYLRILYRSRNDAEPADRVVAPHGLLLGFRRYLVAIDTAKPDKGMRHYRVEDIVEVEVLPSSFEPDPTFSLEDHAQRGFGSYQSDDEYAEVIWRFAPQAADRARRFIFHPGQRVQTGSDGSFTVRFKASGLLEMCWHLYSWGDCVEVLAPSGLAALVEAHRRSDFQSLP